MKVTSKVNNAKLKEINYNATIALFKTADALKTDLQQSQTMPMDTGELQNRSTFVGNKHSDSVSIISDTKYARRLYHHPEYNYKKDKNPKAGGMWFEPYINGNKKNFAKNTFKAFMKGQL